MKRVLLAVESKAVQKAVQGAVQGTDYALTAIDDGYAAIEAALAGAFDVIIAGNKVGGTSAHDIGVALQSTKAPPILLLHEKDEQIDANANRQVGIVDALVIPFAESVLLSKIETLSAKEREAEEAPSALEFEAEEPPAGATEGAGVFEIVAEDGAEDEPPPLPFDKPKGSSVTGEITTGEVEGKRRPSWADKNIDSGPKVMVEVNGAAIPVPAKADEVLAVEIEVGVTAAEPLSEDGGASASEEGAKESGLKAASTWLGPYDSVVAEVEGGREHPKPPPLPKGVAEASPATAPKGEGKGKLPPPPPGMPLPGQPLKRTPTRPRGGADPVTAAVVGPSVATKPAAPIAQKAVGRAPRAGKKETRQPLEQRVASAFADAISGLDPQMAAELGRVTAEVVEKVVWEVVPALAETMIKEELERLDVSRKD